MACATPTFWRLLPAALVVIGACSPVELVAENAPKLPPEIAGPKPAPQVQSPQSDGGLADPIISDTEFDRLIPSLDDSDLSDVAPATPPQDDPPLPALQDGDAVEALADAPVTDPQIDDPLPAIDRFDAEPPPAPVAGEDDAPPQRLRFSVEIAGLGQSGPEADSHRRVRARFDALSALDDAGGRADSRADLASWIRTDRQLLADILNSEGFFDASVEPVVQNASADEPVQILLTAVPGQRYRLGTVAFAAEPDAPVDLIARNFVPAPGDAIVADDIVAAETNIALLLPRTGYPFATIGQRDILLDDAAGTGDYNLPVTVGPRSYFGQIRTEGRLAFDADHVAVLRRFRVGELYDAGKVDDLRAALLATGLLSVVSVEPVASDAAAPDGTAYADLLVRQEAGPARTLAASAGYGTGQGIRAEVSWTHRNLFPPEGALVLSAVAGTQEQAAAVSFNRSNAGRRDRNVELALSAVRRDYDAFNALTGRIGGAISYVSTPIWQKKFTYSVGFELLATYESRFDVTRGARDRQLYYVAALPLQAGFDTSNDLLNPVRGFRVNLRLSPETALGEGSRFYVRSLAEASYYQPFGDDLVLAARARAGSIAGTSRDALPPSRRYYGGGGGSVRGFAFQQLGPRDAEGNPIGGRSLTEAAIEARYRFGNFGVVGFVDAGQVYASALPKFSDLRFGAGIGGRFYTNFGPVRVDVATPIARQPGESRFTLYVSLGQAF